MLAQSKLLIDNEDEAVELILVICNNLFGSNITKKEDVLIDLILNLINSKYPKCTIQDLRNTYISGEIPIVKRQGTSLNRDEFIEHLQNYFQKKAILLVEIEKEAEKVRKEQESIQLEIEYRNHAKAVYLESLKQGKWIGNEFEASAIGKNFSVVISDEDRAIWNPRAKEQERANIIKNEDNPMYVNIPWQKLFAQIAMQELIKRGQKFIEI